METTQPAQSDEVTKGVEQELSSTEFLADEASSPLQPASNNQFDETMNIAEEESEVEVTPSAKASPKPLKKPKAETARPFRRKANRDRTGGFHKENKGRD